MSMSETWQEYSDILRRRLHDNGLVSTAALDAAFQCVPRHHYLDGFYEYHPDGLPHWRWCPAPAHPETDRDWLGQVYRDRGLVILLDENGNPSVTDVAPSLVFRVLGLLGVEGGDRVLSIGAGTGHLAALLARLAGSRGEVLSLEADAGLAASARNRLAALFPDARIAVTQADAREWDPGQERFDDLVATASCWPVPPGWLAGLAPGGRACLELRGNLGGALLRGQRSADDSADASVTGAFTDDTALFKPLLPREALEIPDWFGEDELDRIPADGLGYERLLDFSFGWYCQLEMPDARLIGFGASGDLPPDMFLIADYGLDAVRLPRDASSADAQLVSYGGTSALLERLTAAWRQWQEYGRPARSDFRFSADDGGVQHVVLGNGQKVWKVHSESWFE